ncbi:MAG: BREX-1 system phosphatase PglZ type B [Chloroflexi bacterium]|nr:BREX-1 system phosphatase PglZ type B [Chloroflexota bacterium]
MRIIESLLKTLRSAAAYNPDVQAQPACVLWPDPDSQWEEAIPRLREDMPEILVLGEYEPQQQTGPAIWLRCALAGTAGDLSLPTGSVPVLYLPGVSRQDMRAVESCPENLKPLAELQYRGVIWSQVDGQDWTILAFLESDHGGLGLDVAQDADARNAMQLAVHHLMDEKVESLKGKHLGKDYFNGLLTSGDTIRDILQWLDHPEEFRNIRDDSQWKAFVELSKSQLAFDPQKEGILSGAGKLAVHEGGWRAVWERYCEAPKRYGYIPALIRKCKPPSGTIFWSVKDGTNDGWPQWNEEQETNLRQELVGLSVSPAHIAREAVLELEKQHRRRRQLVWAELGEAPLAQSLEFLAVLAESTSGGLAAGTVEDMAAGYSGHGWRADDALVRALAPVARSQDVEAVAAAIRAMYLSWAEESARHLQKVVDASGYPRNSNTADSVLEPFEDGECVVFVDGLRFDAARRLAQMLAKAGYETSERTSWAALPSVTATGKAAVTPVREKIAGSIDGVDFEPCVARTGQSLRGGQPLKRLLAENGWMVLDRFDSGDGQGRAWSELGDIDREGHDHGWQLARSLDALIGEVRDKIIALVAAGWSKVHVVTDHGWLLLPEGLPKTELPGSLVEDKWGRCASLKPGASTQERLYPWFWNPARYFALADGISCFRKGEEYAHGGLSLQECLTLQLTVARAAIKPTSSREFTDVIWKRLRCTVVVEGRSTGLSIDIRTQPGDPSSSVAVAAKPIKEDGTASVIVEDEDLLGKKATLLLINSGGGIEAQVDTVIGGGESDGT